MAINHLKTMKMIENILILISKIQKCLEKFELSQLDFDFKIRLDLDLICC